MAEATLSLSYDDFCTRVAYRLGYGRTVANWGASRLSLIDDLVQRGYRWFLNPPPLEPGRPAHAWSFLRPTTTITVWPTSTSTLDGAPTMDATGTLSTASYDSDTDRTTITAAAAAFEAYMVGESYKDDGGTSYTIQSVTSTTVCVVQGDASAETGAFTIQVSTVDVDDAVFYDSCVGKEVTVDAVDYTILSVTDTTTVIVSGDATSAEDEDAVTLTADGNYRLPDDFGGMDGRLTFDENEGWIPLDITSESRIRVKRQTSTGSARPVTAAVVGGSSAGLVGQRFDLMLWPTPNAAYVLTYPYYVVLNKLSWTNPFPLGGMVHGETIMAACVAAAEHELEKEKAGEWGKFVDMLQTSIAYDRKNTGPKVFGYNADRSDVRGAIDVPRVTGVTYDGTTWD